jgi:hypothetical protein
MVGFEKAQQQLLLSIPFILLIFNFLYQFSVDALEWKMWHYN